MEVWVRSQDKNRFTQAHNFSYDYEVNKHIVNCNGYPYGVYNSKERCLEIIDEIQKLLYSDFIIVRNCEVDESVAEYLKPTKSIAYQADNKSPSIEYHEQSVVVYEMPRE